MFISSVPLKPLHQTLGKALVHVDQAFCLIGHAAPQAVING
jgi:hypothetical protein